MKRLFIALWPDDKTRQQCAAIIKQIQTDTVSPVKPANLHVTLLFLGNIDAETEKLLKQALAVFPIPKISLCFDQLSFWKQSGILCLTASECGETLVDWVQALSVLARELVISVDERPFKPHVTLVRKAKGLKVLAFEPISWHANSVCLVESRSSSEGVFYEVIDEWT